MSTTPCPHCDAAVPARGERGTCPACGARLRFVAVPDRPCQDCGGPVPLVGQELARCLSCGLVQAEDPERPVRHETTCVRCRRRLRIEPGERDLVCPHCGAALRLVDTV